MKVKNKNFVGIMMLAIMLLFGLSSTAKAAAVIAYSGTITIANNATQSVSLGGDITISGAAADMVSGSTVSIACPAGLRFDTNNVAININSNVTCTGFTVSVFTGTGYVSGYKTDGTEIKLNVTSSATGTIKFAGSGSVTEFAVLPTAATASAGTLNVAGQTFTVTTNGGTTSPLAQSIGSISILEPPAIVSATLVSGTAADVLFSTNVLATSTALGANAADDTTDGTPVFLITTGNGTATAITTVSGTSALDATNKALLHITGITGTIYTGNNIAFQDPSGKKITNALGAINGPATSPAVPINPANPIITSVVIGNAPKYTGDAATADAAWNNVSTFTATVTATASSVVKVRVPNGTVATTGITWTATGTDASVKSDDGLGVGTMLMPSGGSTVVTATLSNNSLCATANTVITGTVQASLDNFLSSTSSTSGDLIIDRKQPVITGTPTSPSRYSMVGLFSEDIDSTTVVPTGFKLDGDNSLGGADGANIVSVQLGSDKKTFTLTTNLLNNATNNKIAATTTIKDLAGNEALTTASSAFTTQGTASTKTSITGLGITSAAAGSMIISNSDTVSVTVEGPTGLVSSVKARLVNGTTGVTLTNFAGTFSEYGIGQYRGTIQAPNPIPTGTTSVKAQGTMDSVQYTESSESLTVDNTAPTLTSAVGAGTTAALLTFSKEMHYATSNLAITTTGNYKVNTSVTPTAAIFRSPNQVVLQFAAVTPGSTVTIDVNSLAAPSGIQDLTFNIVPDTGVIGVDKATYTAPAADTVAPTILGVTVGADNKTVTATMTDAAGSAAVDISNDMTTTKTKVTQVLKGVVPQSGVITNNASAVQSIFTADTALANGTDYTVVVQATDLAANVATRTSTFTVCGDPVATATPATVAPGGTSTVSATGAVGPITAAITTDTSGGATISGSGPWTVTAGPGSTVATTIVVTVTDACSGRTDDVTITVSAQCVLTVSATKSAVNGEKISVSASGGVLPYVYELTTATATGAAIDPVSGDYLAPSVSGSTVETETIKATDANGCSGTTTVKITTDAVAVTTTGSGTSVTISGGTGATFAIKDGVGAVTAGGVYTSTEDGVGIVRVTKGTETADVIIKVASGICTVESPVMVQDVNMDGSVGLGDLTPVIDKILE
jgi:hypothetical protein